ncbi:MAG: hypothetical protein K6F04_03525 [bacterium]|nr:hypothetical protein [bacterium]
MKKLIALLSVVVLGACSSTSDTLFAGSETSKPAKESSTAFDGTFIKNKIANFGSEQAELKKLVDGRKDALQVMRNETNTAVSDYRSAVAQINSKLQLGTTPGNPELMDEWKEARAKLEKINNIAFDIKRLVADVESDQSMVDYMVGSIQASYKIRGATEDEHKQLKSLEEEAKQIGSNISIFARQLNAEAERQQAYVENEKYNLNDVALNIKNGKLYGMGGSSTDFFANGGSMFSSDDAYNAFMEENEQEYGYASRRAPAPRRQPMVKEDRNVMVPMRAPVSVVEKVSAPVAVRPIAVVKFDKTNVEFEEPLYQALSRSLERNPSATFEVVGVAPQGKPSANVKKDVKAVMNALTEMGLPASRVAITMKTENVDFDEVRVFEK